MLCANQKELKSRLVELDKSAFKIASIQTSFVSKDFFMNNLISSILTFYEEGNTRVSAGHCHIFLFLLLFSTISK